MSDNYMTSFIKKNDNTFKGVIFLAIRLKEFSKTQRSCGVLRDTQWSMITNGEYRLQLT